MANTSINTTILTSLHGKEIGLTKDRSLVVPEGFVSTAGCSPGAGTLAGAADYKSSVTIQGNVAYTQIYIDITGLQSSTTDLDIIGKGVGVAHIGRVTTAVNGLIFAGRMGCLVVPTTGADDIDLYSATEGTGAFDAGIAGLAETALVTAGGAWTRTNKVFTLLPAADEYLYLTNGEAGTVGTYDAGKFLIELWGYVA